MPKTKTRSAAKKRFKVTGTGKILRRSTMRSHNLEHKSSKRKRAFGKDIEATRADTSALKKMLRIR
jgi:large subunit ribosomal protein L35